MKANKTGTESKKFSGFARIEKFHPHKTFLFFALLGSTLVFMSITLLYFISVKNQGKPGIISLPKEFFVSTVLLLFSGFTVSKISNCFRRDDASALQTFLLVTMVLGVFFLGCQVAGWKKMFDSGFGLDAALNVSFLYVISGIHFLHVAAGVLYLSVLYFKILLHTKDPIRKLVYFSNDYHLTQLQLAAIFWHFVDFLWLGLFFIFLFTF